MPAPFDLVPPLLEGLWVTLQLTFAGALLAALAALLAGLAVRSTSRALRWPARIYIEFFRGTSALVQLYWVFYALPLFGVSLTPMTTGILVLGLNIGSYGAEVVRGAVNAIPEGQREACIALSLPRFASFFHVIAPQALVRILPPAGNLIVELMKSTALVSLVTLSDLTFRGMVLRAETQRTAEIFMILLIIYFCSAMALTTALRFLERRLKKDWHLEALS